MFGGPGDFQKRIMLQHIALILLTSVPLLHYTKMEAAQMYANIGVLLYALFAALREADERKEAGYWGQEWGISDGIIIAAPAMGAFLLKTGYIALPQDLAWAGWGGPVVAVVAYLVWWHTQVQDQGQWSENEVAKWPEARRLSVAQAYKAKWGYYPSWWAASK